MTPFSRCLPDPVLSGMLVHDIDLNKNKELDQPTGVSHLIHCQYLIMNRADKGWRRVPQGYRYWTDQKVMVQSPTKLLLLGFISKAP